MGTVNIPNGRFTTPQYKANGYSSTYNGVTLTLSGSSDTRLYFDKSTPQLYLFATSGSNTSDINLKAQSGYSIQAVIFTLNDNFSLAPTYKPATTAKAPTTQAQAPTPQPKVERLISHSAQRTTLNSITS